MLTALHIRNFVLIGEATLSLQPGLTALTGETGAGKSILLDALGLAAGGRAERASVRQGAGEGSVSAAFEPGADHNVCKTLAANALPTDGDQVILRRVLSKDGKSRAFVNDAPVSAALLREIGETLVEIHGQHDGRGFLTASTHRDLLDAWGALAAMREAVGAAFRVWREAEGALEDRRAGRASALADADWLRHVVAELVALDPKADEEAALAARRSALQAADRIADDLGAALAALAEDGLEGKLRPAARRLARAGAQFPDAGNPLAPALARIEAAISEAMEARAAVESAIERLGADAGALEKTEERLFALRAAARKHGVAVEGLPGALTTSRAALEALDGGEAGFEALERQVAAAHDDFAQRARALSAARANAAAALDAAVAKELKPLKLGKAEFLTRIVSNDEAPHTDGVDQVEFMVRTNPGAPAGPLKTIASGGELSRFVLAMKAALAAKEMRTVVIFDEVDAGVGGAVADAVGERLQRLAREAQVLVVTHSPQVAARAQTHWRVEKRQGANETTARVEVLSGEARVEEIARMLSGATTTDEARAAARRLLGEAAAPARRKRA